MTITKKQKINYINVDELKTLQVIGSKQIVEDDLVIADSPLAFHLAPTEIVSDRQEYKDLPDSEKAKVDELTHLWTAQVKADYEAHSAESTKVTALEAK